MRTNLATRSLAMLLLQDQQARDAFHSRLTNFLDVLYVLAIVLGVVLLIVAAIALRVYLKNKSDARRESARPDRPQ